MTSKLLFALFCLSAVGFSSAGNIAVLVTDAEGKPAPNVVVTVNPSTKAASTAPSASFTLNQERMQFQPFVSVIPVGAKVKFANKDPFQHHTKSFSPAKTFEVRMDAAKDGKPFLAAEEVLFDKAGHVSMQCHFHGSMRGHIMVTDAPHYGVTDANGALVIPNVPSGEVELKAWHPEQFIEQKTVRVRSTADTASATMQLNMNPRPRRS
jgi:plastocyanin